MLKRRQFLAGCSSLAALGGFASEGGAGLPKIDAQAVLAKFRERRDETDDRVRSGIEKNRKGDFTLRLAAADGRPFERAHVRLVQKSHDFRHGANLFLLGEFKGREESEYERLFAEAFNLATLAFYWNTLEPRQGHPRYGADSEYIYRRPPTDLCVDWCVRRGIEPKVHCLNYPKIQPEWMKEHSTPARDKAFIEKRFRELAERYADRIPMWEVTNECLIRDHRVTALYREPDLIEWSYRTAARYFKNNRLIVNDDVWHRAGNYLGTRSDYYMMVENALLKGCRIDGVGLQFHMFQRGEAFVRQAQEMLDPCKIFDLLDTYALLKRPLQLTEITIPAFSNNAADEAAQAEIIRQLYSIWFSHPAMEAIIYWNLVDGYAYGERGDMTSRENACYGGLVRKDFTPKPSYEVIRELFGKTWRTNLERDCGNTLAFRGFYGTYGIRVTIGGRTVERDVHFGKGADSAEITC